jgi:hypothetical protein
VTRVDKQWIQLVHPILKDKACARGVRVQRIADRERAALGHQGEVQMQLELVPLTIKDDSDLRGAEHTRARARLGV